MALKTPVVDRIPTYPGRVVLTPVSGAENTYDLVRADQPIEEGTPINAKLFNQKAYTLTEDTTVYVSGSGSDAGGDGTSAAPYATIQKAIDSLPQWLDGHKAVIDITPGTYAEDIVISGFRGGQLVVGVAGRAVTVQTVSVNNSSVVQLNVSKISHTTTPLLYVGQGSTVMVMSALTVDGKSASAVGFEVEHGSVLAAQNVAVDISNTIESAALALSGGRIAFGIINGSGNGGIALRANGGSISYAALNLVATTEKQAENGGRVYTGSYDDAYARLSGATMIGTLVAGTQTPSTSLVRNSMLVKEDTTPAVNGEIYWTYG